MRISSTDNPLARRLRRYGESPRACREAGRSIAEGLHLVEAALAAGVPISAVVVSEEAHAAARELARRAADSARTRVVEFARSLYDQIAPVEHGAGILAEIAIARPELPRLQAVDAVFLDGVQDPGNAGTLLRSAAAAGVRHVAASTGHSVSVGAQGSARRDGRALRAVDLRGRCGGPPGGRLHRRAPRGRCARRRDPVYGRLGRPTHALALWLGGAWAERSGAQRSRSGGCAFRSPLASNP